ncbi:MAG: hypothetical protein HC903_02270 [Methylacidiphilales bacterium]|nr:hypothetical protein [Candidatus Methylacidiphilales bacterium]NJR16711.1 hypothetical protein [Calothrix sp. CSU_2_0]
MFISDLTYLEVVNEATNIQGAGDVAQFVLPVQFATAAVGGAGRNSIGNTALALNIAIPTVTGTGVL